MVRKFPPFRSERKKRSTSEGTPQFLNGISGKLPYHLTSNRNFRIFSPNGKHPSSPLVPTRCLLFLVTNGNLTLLFFIWEQIVPTRCLLFLVTNCNLRLLFFIWEQIVRTRCLLFLVINGNLILLFFIWE